MSNIIQNGGAARIADPDSSNSLRFIPVDEATIHGNNNYALGNKDSGIFSHDLKLSRAHLEEENRKIGM